MFLNVMRGFASILMFLIPVAFPRIKLFVLTENSAKIYSPFLSHWEKMEKFISQIMQIDIADLLKYCWGFLRYITRITSVHQKNTGVLAISFPFYSLCYRLRYIIFQKYIARRLIIYPHP